MDTAKCIESEYGLACGGASAIKILQDPTGQLKLGVGATVWDAAFVLSKYIEKQVKLGSLDLSGKTVLELGSGTGVVGLSVALIEPTAKVILSDKLELLPLLQHNVDLNNAAANTSVQCIDWTAPAGIATHPDYILVSDGIWVTDIHEPLANTLGKLAGPQTKVLMAYESRRFEDEAKFMALWGNRFRFHDIKPADQDEMWQSEDIFLFEGALKN
ncbi:Protein-lysine N-methyltransferase efm6 [Linderina pennispora]|nr:Protein-lysine N-methyltransferase efm6 [Linderina pennispora]